MSAFDRRPPEHLRIRGVGNRSLLCRPGTTDPWVLWDTFHYLYHLPPIAVPQDGCVLDLGANVGYTAAHFAHLYGRARVVAVEMDAGNARLARENLAQFGSRCTVVEAAVWSHDGEIEYGGSAEWGFRVAGVAERDGRDRRTRALTIDRLFSECAIDTVDYLKMDIEGAEAEVLTGDLAWSRRVRSLKVEVHPPATIDACAWVLRRAGFACERDRVHNHCVIGTR